MGVGFAEAVAGDVGARLCRQGQELTLLHGTKARLSVASGICAGSFHPHVPVARVKNWRCVTSPTRSCHWHQGPMLILTQEVKVALRAMPNLFASRAP
jgi:hypothetical protein